MDIEKIFFKKINSIKATVDVIEIILIGKASKLPFERWQELKDIDLFVIKEDGEYEREVYPTDGVEFDISYMTKTHMKKFNLHKRVKLLNMFINGKKLINEDSEINKIIDDMKRTVEFGPDKIDDIEKKQLSFSIWQSLEDIFSRNDDTLNQNFLIYKLLNEMIDTILSVNNIWIPVDKKKLSKLKTVDKKAFSIAEKIIVSNDINQKIELSTQMADLVSNHTGYPIEGWQKGPYPFGK